MKIVLDTTVFENGFNGRSAEVPLLKSFLTRTSSELCIPSVVHQEALNRVRKRVADTNSKIDSVHRLTGGREGFQKVNPEDALRTHSEALKALLLDLNARILPYPTTSHEDLVRRALVPKRPFVEGGRGYRDALIWHNLIELLSASTDEVVFVSENSTDWSGNRKGGFHPDFVSELREKGLRSERLSLVPSLAEFNRNYTVSSLALEQIHSTVEDRPVDYVQLLIDGKELIEGQLLIALPDSLRRVGVNIVSIGEFGVLGLSHPENVQHEPPRILDSERRLLLFSAEYRVMLDLIIGRSEASWWMTNFSFQLVQDWHFDQIRAYVTLPVRASFHMIERGENTEQFSLASAEIAQAESGKQ